MRAIGKLRGFSIMERFVLFIREGDRSDVSYIRSSKERAKRALAAYVRRKSQQPGMPMQLQDEEVIEAYFTQGGGQYVIAMVKPCEPARRRLS
jgi:hypothetical protein